MNDEEALQRLHVCICYYVNYLLLLLLPECLHLYTMGLRTRRDFVLFLLLFSATHLLLWALQHGALTVWQIVVVQWHYFFCGKVIVCLLFDKATLTNPAAFRT